MYFCTNNQWCYYMYNGAKDVGGGGRGGRGEEGSTKYR